MLYWLQIERGTKPDHRKTKTYDHPHPWTLDLSRLYPLRWL